jgi:hypothetical protein
MVLLDSPRYSRMGFIFNFNYVFLFKFLNLYAQAYVPVSKCSPYLGSTMSKLAYTARAVLPGTLSPLSSSCGPPLPTRAVLSGTHSPLSSSSGPSRLARAVLPGTGIPMSTSSGPLVPLEHLLTGGVGSPKIYRLSI